MLVDVRHRSSLNGLRLRVHLHQLHDLRVLHRGHVHLNVRLMVLLDERFDGLADQQVLVLLHWINRHRIIFNRHKLACVFDAKNLDHLAVQHRQVVQLRRCLCKLEHSLILHNLLRHRRGVRIGHGDHVHQVVVFLTGGATRIHRLVVVVLGAVISDDSLEQLELLLHGKVQAGLNGCHHLERALQNRQRSADRGLRAHVADLHIARRGKRPTFLDDVLEQRIQNLTRFLVRQWQDVVADRTARDVYVSELAGGNRCVITFNAKPA